MAAIHVVFGAGPVGLALVDALVAQHLPVRVVHRAGAAPLPNGIEEARGDASDPGFAAEAAAGAAAVYQCLGLPYARWADLFPPLQRAVVAAAETTGARYVSFENLYPYGDTRGVPIREDLPVTPHTRKGKVRAAMAAELQQRAETGDLQCATARASDYFGPRATWQSPLGERVIGRAIAGRPAQVVGDPDQPHSYAYLPDIGRTLAVLGTDERALGKVWHVPCAPAETTRALVGMIAEALGHEIKITTAPRWLLRMIGLFDPTVRELDEMLYQFTQPFVVDGSAFSKTFGTAPTPLAQSIPETVAWWRAQG